MMMSAGPDASAQRWLTSLMTLRNGKRVRRQPCRSQNLWHTGSRTVFSAREPYSWPPWLDGQNDLLADAILLLRRGSFLQLPLTCFIRYPLCSWGTPLEPCPPGDSFTSPTLEPVSWIPSALLLSYPLDLVGLPAQRPQKECTVSCFYSHHCWNQRCGFLFFFLTQTNSQTLQAPTGIRQFNSNLTLTP